MKSLSRAFLLVAAVVLATGWLWGAERIPPAPPRYFNDYAGVVSAATAARLNAQLEQFERASSNQLVVAIYPKRESDSSVEDYTVRVAQAWRAGQAGRNNGAVLFAFMQEREVYLQVGYGLEPVLTDALAKRIIEGEIVPRFRAGDIDGGMTAAVNAMIAATKGEYKGTGRTQAERGRASGGGMSSGLIVLFVIIIVITSLLRNAVRRPSVFLNPRRRGIRPNIWWGGGGGWGGGSGGSFGGGGRFSGGGGSFGGGGAGGKW